MKVCKYCNRPVQPKRSFSWGMFLILCVTGIGGVLYFAFYLFKRPQCPICGCRKFTRKVKTESFQVSPINILPPSYNNYGIVRGTLKK